VQVPRATRQRRPFRARPAWASTTTEHRLQTTAPRLSAARPKPPGGRPDRDRYGLAADTSRHRVGRDAFTSSRKSRPPRTAAPASTGTGEHIVALAGQFAPFHPWRIERLRPFRHQAGLLRGVCPSPAHRYFRPRVTTSRARNAIIHQGRLDPGVEVLLKPLTQREAAKRARESSDDASAAARTCTSVS
jgi:hypothetical protein